jgi:hypothetical protein
MRSKKIEGFEDYTIFENGIIMKNTGKVLKPNASAGNRGGYLRVNLYKEGRYKTLAIHRLLAFYFIPNPKKYSEIDHIDGDRLNNKLDNLRWCTRSENMRNNNVVRNSSSKYIGVSWCKTK